MKTTKQFINKALVCTIPYIYKINYRPCACILQPLTVFII